MGRKPKKDRSTDVNVGQHVLLPVAVQLASSKLLARTPDNALGGGILNVIGNALARVVPVYFQDPAVPKPRPLSEGELEGSRVMDRATMLVLKDGRTLTSVSIRRRDLRRGIAVLRTAGIPELSKGPAQKPAAPYPELMAKVAEMEELVRPPLLPSQLGRVHGVALSIARNTADDAIADLAIRLLSAVHDARSAGEIADSRAIELLVARLRNVIRDKAKNNA